MRLHAPLSADFLLISRFLFTEHELLVSPVKAAIFVFVVSASLKYELVIGIAFYCPRKTFIRQCAFPELALLGWYFDVFRLV